MSIKIRPVNVVLTCQSSQHFSLANHSVAVDRTATQVTLAAGVSKVGLIHDVRATSSHSLLISCTESCLSSTAMSSVWNGSFHTPLERSKCRVVGSCYSCAPTNWWSAVALGGLMTGGGVTPRIFHRRRRRGFVVGGSGVGPDERALRQRTRCAGVFFWFYRGQPLYL